MIHKHPVFALSLFLAVAGAVILGGCHSGLAHWCLHGSPEEKADWIEKRVTKDLKLNPDQKAKLALIKKEILAKHKECLEPHERLLNVFLDEAVMDTIDQKKLDRSIDDTHRQMETMRPFLISKFSEFHAMLTPAQRMKFAEKIRKFHLDWKN